MHLCTTVGYMFDVYDACGGPDGSLGLQLYMLLNTMYLQLNMWCVCKIPNIAYCSSSLEDFTDFFVLCKREICTLTLFLPRGWWEVWFLARSLIDTQKRKTLRMSNIPVIEAETVETVCWDPASVYLKDNVDKTPSEEEHMQPNVNATVQFNVLHRFYWVFKVFFCFDLEPRGHVTWCWAGSCWRVHDLCSTSQIPSSTLAHIFLNCVTMWLGVYSFMMRVGTCSLERGCLVQGQPLCPKTGAECGRRRMDTSPHSSCISF